MSEILNLTEAVPASSADADEAPWCLAHWADLSTRTGAEAADGQHQGGGVAGAADAALSTPVTAGVQVAL